MNRMFGTGNVPPASPWPKPMKSDRIKNCPKEERPRENVHAEQGGMKRAGYGAALLEDQSRRLPPPRLLFQCRQ